MNKHRVLRLFFEFLNENFENVIVGDTRSYPLDVGSDIDIILKPQDIEKFGIQIRVFAKQNELRLIQRFQHEANAIYYILISIQGDGGDLFYVHPDISSDYYRKGRLFLLADDLLDNRVKSLGFYKPSPDRAFIYYLLKKVDKGALSQSHFEYLMLEWNLDILGCKGRISEFFNESNRKLIVRSFERNNHSILTENIREISKDLDSKVRYSMRSVLLEIKRIIGRLIYPTGLTVVFLGPDGSGKSTVLDQVMQDLEPAFRSVEYFHLRPHIFGNKSEGVTVDNPHGQKERSKLASLLKICYWAFDYTLGYFLKVYTKKVKSTLITFDRYYYDILIDKRRYRYSGPTWILKFISKLIPSPDLIFLFDAPAEVLQQRKQEVSFADSASQRIVYLEIIEKMSNGVVIDASQEVSKVVRDVDNNIAAFLEKRLERRGF